MTSKNLYFKLMKEDAKRRLWLIALLMLVFVFAYPVTVAMMIGDYSLYAEDHKAQLFYMTQKIEEWFSANNYLVVVLMMMSAVVTGISGFAFLFSKKKVDFYHSIPVKREVLFIVNCLNGILLTGVVYAMNLVLSAILIAVNGVGNASIFQDMFSSFFIHMTYFILMYSVVIAAVMLTGNLIISLLGTAVFFLYGPAVVCLTIIYHSAWFATYYGWNDSKVLQFGYHLSPASEYLFASTQIGEGKMGMASLLLILVISVIIFGLDLWLYKKRPSESAEKAMAFEKSKTPIKILLVIPLSLFFGVIFWQIRSNIGWAVFGGVFGSVFVHCLMEIIYGFDFRQLFKNKIHLLVCTLASILILLGFQYDIMGYDRYIPEESKLESVSIGLGLDNWVTYGNIKVSDSYDSMGDKIVQEYSWAHEYSEEHIAKNMRITNVDPVLDLVQKGIDITQQNKGQSQRNPSSIYNINSITDKAPRTFCYVVYHLTNGSTASRRYTIPTPEIESMLSQIYKDPDYKKGVYPLLTQTAADTSIVNYQETNQVTDLSLGKIYGKEEELEELLLTYQNELGQLLLEERRLEDPIGMIQFQSDEIYQAAKVMESRKRGEKLSAYDYYPVYASFTKTIELLKQYGVNPGTGLNADMVTDIIITDGRLTELYNGDPEAVLEETIRSQTESSTEMTTSKFGSYQKLMNEYGETVYQFTDSEQIQQILPGLVSMESVNLNGLSSTIGSVTVVVKYRTDNQMKEGSYLLSAHKYPDFLKEVLK